MNFDRLQLTLVLGLYYIDKSKNIESFTNKFNRYFHLSISTQTVLFALVQFKNIDPSTNIKNKDEGSVFNNLWTEYITSDKLAVLKEIYRAFKQDKYLSAIGSLEVLDDIEIVHSDETLKIVDVPEKRPINLHSSSVNVYPRLKEVVNKALRLANYKCENPLCSTQLFLRKDGKTQYTEAHHLIPLCYQNNFDFSLDVEANVVSLCPNCHCLLHYGQEKDKLIQQLYNDRIERLKKCNLNVTYEELLLMYR